LFNDLFNVASVPESTLYNVENISSDRTSNSENWTLSCMASDGTSNSSWLNDTVVIEVCPETVSNITENTNLYGEGCVVQTVNVQENGRIDCAGGGLTGSGGFTLALTGENSALTNCTLQNVNLVVDVPSGGIVFPTLNATITDTTNNIVIQPRSIYVDSTALPDLDVPASLTFRNTGYTTLEQFDVYKDGVECTDCVEGDIVNGTFNMNVTGFSNFTLRDGIDYATYKTVRDDAIYILGVFALVVVLLAATFVVMFVFGKMEIDVLLPIILALAAGAAVLMAVFYVIAQAMIV